MNAIYFWGGDPLGNMWFFIGKLQFLWGKGCSVSIQANDKSLLNPRNYTLKVTFLSKFWGLAGFRRARSDEHLLTQHCVPTISGAKRRQPSTLPQPPSHRHRPPSFPPAYAMRHPTIAATLWLALREAGPEEAARLFAAHCDSCEGHNTHSRT